MCPLRLGLGLALAAVALACDPPSVEDPAAVRAALMNADRQFAAATAAQ